MPGRCCVAQPRCSDKMQLRSAALLFVLLAAFITAAQAQEKWIVLEHPLVLADADGKTVTSDDFPGKFLLVYFGYSHCADQCPTALSAMVEALDQIGPAADQIQPLFVTVDPERDRGAALRDFTAAFAKRLVGLTGSPPQVAAPARAGPGAAPAAPRSPRSRPATRHRAAPVWTRSARRRCRGCRRPAGNRWRGTAASTTPRCASRSPPARQKTTALPPFRRDET